MARRDIGLDRGVSRESLGLTAAIDDGADDPGKLCFGASGNDDPMTLAREPPGQRGTKSLFGTNPDNNSGALKRAH